MNESGELMQIFTPEELTGQNAGTSGVDYDAALLRLLAARTERYTMGESSSVTIETAQALLQSIRYTLALGCKAQGYSLATLPAGTALPTLLLAGQAEAECRVAIGKTLLMRARSLLSGVDDAALQETLAELVQFFKRYDLWFFAHDIPCAIDYILDEPISENLQGIDYVNAYLKALISEGRAVPLRRKEEEARLNALLAQEEMQYTDGDAAQDDMLRALIEALNDCQTATEKAMLVKEGVHSLRDMTEVLDVCFWAEESIAIFEQMGRAELALLYHFIQNRPKEKRSPTGWEQALENYISNHFKEAHQTKTP
ncbi:MAG TPA: DUF6179 domain-containing protein [Clostridia bacterium]|nr:DUF6179 domain-containing protein [Clostridia bacterium]